MARRSIYRRPNDSPQMLELAHHLTAADLDSQLLSLAACLDHLRARDPHVAYPAHVTLKRWSAAGVLAPAISESPGRRPLYKVGVVREICLKQMAGRPGSAQDSSVQVRSAPDVRAARPDPARSPASPSDGQLETMLHQLEAMQAQQTAFQSQVTAALESVAEQLAKFKASVDNLDAVRRMLMLKSDNEVTGMRARLDAANHEVARLRAGSTSVDAGKLATVLVRVEEALRQTDRH